MDTLERDAKILKRHNIMDYSLLLCIEKNPHFKEVKGMSKGPSSTSSDDNNESGMMSKSIPGVLIHLNSTLKVQQDQTHLPQFKWKIHLSSCYH